MGQIPPWFKQGAGLQTQWPLCTIFLRLVRKIPRYLVNEKEMKLTGILQLDIVCGILVVLVERVVLNNLKTNLTLEYRYQEGMVSFCHNLPLEMSQMYKKIIIKSLSILNLQLENGTRGKDATCQPMAHNIPGNQNLKLRMDDVILHRFINRLPNSKSAVL